MSRTISKSGFKWSIAACALTLLSAAPVLADDTELLLINPDPSTEPKPNILFILDTSGSMGSLEETVEPYDSGRSYTGPCDTNNIYWTSIDIVPVCNGSQTRYVEKSAFHCQFAQTMIDGVGSYTGTAVQFRSGSRFGFLSRTRKTWQFLAPGFNDDPVECEADSGVHGDGRPTFLWARSGVGISDPYTDRENREISWGSTPRNASYTFYDGNYLNWKASAALTSMTRLNIVKEVVVQVLSSVSGINVGLMRFNRQDGGPVIAAMGDLDSDRQRIIDAVRALTANGNTPLSETLYESALYWRGMPAYYGERINEWATDPAALRSTSPEAYLQPTSNACAKNYNVLLTDGMPVNDFDTPALAPTLPRFAAALGRSNCTFVNQGDCLDDIAEYLSKEDIDGVTDGDQFVTTHTIGFTIDLPILADTARVSGGQYYLADDVETLTRSLMSILGDIGDKSLSFAAPAVSVNTFNRTQNLNSLYMTTFSPKNKTHWPGNLKKYQLVNREITDVNGVPAVDPATGFFKTTAKSYWTVGAADGNTVKLGGAARQIPNPATRKLYTSNGDADLTAAENRLTPANAGTFTNADFGLTGAPGEPSIDQLIRWARGEDLRDEDSNPSTTVRFAMGDAVHSQPAAIVYGGTPTDPDTVVYMATNDGYLHAIDGRTGQELWSFIPKQLLVNLPKLYIDPDTKYKQYGIDGSVVPAVKDENQNGIIDGDDFVYILFGMRRGGTSYFALDVTNKTAPKLLWNVDYAELGESWSTPVVTRMDINVAGLNADDAVVIIGGGYDNVHDTAEHPAFPDDQGNGIHILDLASGARLWRAGPDTFADLPLSTMTRAIPTQVRVIDLNGDRYADRMYAADLGGQLWRFDITKGATPANLVAGGVIARLGAEGLVTPDFADTRRFYNAPDVSIFTDPALDRKYVSVSIGSGYREHPYDLSATDRFYSIRDPDVFNRLTQADYDSYSIVTDADLVEVSGRTQVVLQSTDRGWKFTLPNNQKVLADSLTFDDEVFFTAFSPDSFAATNCNSTGRGTNFLYRVSVINGDPIVNNLDTLDPADADAARHQALEQGGIAPTPTVLFPGPDDPATCTGTDCAPPPIMCIGVECIDPGFANNPVRTAWFQDGVQ